MCINTLEGSTNKLYKLVCDTALRSLCSARRASMVKPNLRGKLTTLLHICHRVSTLKRTDVAPAEVKRTLANYADIPVYKMPCD